MTHPFLAVFLQTCSLAAFAGGVAAAVVPALVAVAAVGLPGLAPELPSVGSAAAGSVESGPRCIADRLGQSVCMGMPWWLPFPVYVKSDVYKNSYIIIYTLIMIVNCMHCILILQVQQFFSSSTLKINK